MKKLLFILICGTAVFAQSGGMAQVRQSLSIPARTPVHCSMQTNDCAFNVYSNTTAIVVARFSSFATITGSLGETWTSDQCLPSTGTCIWHADFPASLASWCGLCGDKLTFAGNQFTSVFILVYDGVWSLDTSNIGTYKDQNSDLGCINEESCPYAWTLPIETERGNLIVSWFDSSSMNHIARPGPGYALEIGDGTIFVEDMIAPISGIYIGSFILNELDGNEASSYWLEGVAAYKR